MSGESRRPRRAPRKVVREEAVEERPEPKPEPKPALVEDGVWGAKTDARFQEVIGGEDRHDCVKQVQRALNDLGFTGLTGQKLVVDGKDLYGNVNGPTVRTDTIYALSKAVGVSYPDGKFDQVSTAVRNVQRNLNKGALLP